MSVTIAVIDDDGFMKVWKRSSCEIVTEDVDETSIRFMGPTPYMEFGPRASLKLKLGALGLTEVSEAEAFDFDRMYADAGSPNPVEYALRNTFGLTVRQQKLPTEPGSVILADTPRGPGLFLTLSTDGNWWDGGGFYDPSEVRRMSWELRR